MTQTHSKVEYSNFCQQRREEPDKPFSGYVILRLPAEVHRKGYVLEKMEGKSLNAYPEYFTWQMNKP